MYKVWFSILLIAIYVSVNGCDGGGGGAGTGGGTDTTYVDSNNGNDITGDGTSKNPYRTITYTLNQPSTRNKIKIEYGVYNESIGEQFPIILPTGKTLIADTIIEKDNLAALISGSGVFISDYINGTNSVAVVFNGASAIQNVVIKATDGVAMWVERASTSSRILSNGLIDSQIGLVLVNNASPKISRNVVRNNQQIGIEVINNASPTLRKNSIYQNNIGLIVADSARPNFGNVIVGGGNSIKNNTMCDFQLTGIGDLKLVGTSWDEDVFEFLITNNCSAGANIVVDGAGSVDYQFIPPRDVLLFQNQRRIRLDQPQYGEVIFTNEPNFEWASTGGRITMIVVWRQPPSLGITEITSTDDIEWLWHTGLKTGGAGYVLFSDGVSLEEADYSRQSPPQPFRTGRSYYWAVWEWDTDRELIYASSSLSYFRVSN